MNLLPVIRPPAPPDPAPLIVVSGATLPRWFPAARAIVAKVADAAGRLGRPALHRIVDPAIALARSLAGRLVAGALDLAAWFSETINTLIPRHVAGAMALDRGDEPAMDAREDLADLINRQAGFFARFRRDVAMGGQPRDGTLVGRSGLYGAAIWSVALAAHRAKIIAAGVKTQERSILEEGAHDHCWECPAEAGRGWVDLDGPYPIVPVGARACGANCRCFMVYR